MRPLTRNNLVSFFKREWGSLWLFVFLIPALFKLFYVPLGGHYEIFSTASRDLWNGVNPHEHHYAYGYYIYHAAAGLFFYGLFNLFTHPFGQFLYVTSTFLFLYLGMRRFCASISLKDSYRNLLFFIACSEILGTTLNARLELFIGGAIFWALSFYMENKMAKSALLLSIPAVFKFQALAIAGLIGLSAIKQAPKNLRSYAWPLYFTLGFFIVFFSPILVLGWGATLEQNENLSTRLALVLPEVFRDFLHIFRFFTQLTSVEVTLALATKIGALVALGFAAMTALQKEKYPHQRLFVAVGLSCVYMTSFSLMSQSAAYSLVLPLYAIAFLDYQSLKVKIGIWGSWFFMSILYSDLVPAAYRKAVFGSAIKAVGPLFLFAFWYWAQRQKPLKLQNQA